MKCEKCKVDKSDEDFWPNNTWCKDCNLTRMKKKWDRAQREETDEQIIRFLLRNSRRRAKQIGTAHTITAKDLSPLAKTCPVFGTKLSRAKGKFNNYSYSLDRIQGDQGYVPGNVRVLSWRANFHKGQMTLQEAENLVAYMKGER